MATLRRALRIALRLVATSVVLGLGLAGCLWWYFTPDATVTRGVIYAQRHGKNLTLDVLQPANASGIGVLAMVSGSWKSSPAKFKTWMAAPFLREGQTVFAVSHLSQPEASVMEIVEDVQRAARFVRLHAPEYRVDPNRLGVFGGSSGGHLSLMLATRGGPGPAGASDPVDRQSSAVQAAGVFFPVTDLLNLGPSTENLGDGGPPKNFRRAFGPNGTDLTAWKVIGREVSPFYHVTPSMPPVFITHGDADTLVPLEQSVRFKQKAAATGHDILLTVRAGKNHGWLTMPWDVHLIATWFTQHLGATRRMPR